MKIFAGKIRFMAILFLAAAFPALLFTCGSDSDDEQSKMLALLAGGSRPFPVTTGNVFSIQYRNSTKVAIKIWLAGQKPPCSQAVAADGTWDSLSWTNSNYATNWQALNDDGTFSSSGTSFQIIPAKGARRKHPARPAGFRGQPAATAPTSNCLPPVGARFLNIS